MVGGWKLETGKSPHLLCAFYTLKLTTPQDFGTFIAMKPIRFDRHARKRMKDRRVHEDEVRATIEDPDFIEQSVKGRFNAFKYFNKRYLRVTFKKELDHMLVITVTIRKKPFKE